MKKETNGNLNNLSLTLARIREGWERDQKGPTSNIPLLLTSAKVKISPKIFLTFSPLTLL